MSKINTHMNTGARKIPKKGAFTLAEVLITLGIIGIVAAMTLPSLISNAQDAQLKAAWKKEYSMIEQATRLVMKDNGGTLKNVFTDGLVILNQYANYLSYSKRCTNHTLGNCWGDSGTKTPIGTTFNTDAWWDNQSGFALNDGAYVLLQTRSAGCTENVYGSTPDGIGYCALILVDVNGAKSPNVLGKDVYWIGVQQGGVYPFGATGSYVGDCHFNPPSGSGLGCGAQFLMNN